MSCAPKAPANSVSYLLSDDCKPWHVIKAEKAKLNSAKAVAAKALRETRAVLARLDKATEAEAKARARSDKALAATEAKAKKTAALKLAVAAKKAKATKAVHTVATKTVRAARAEAKSGLSDACGPVLIWEGTVVTEEQYEEVTTFLMNALGLRTPPVILGSTTTLPNRGDQSGETGGRIDFMFRICESDIRAAAARRFCFPDMRWASDAKKSIYSAAARRQWVV